MHKQATHSTSEILKDDGDVAIYLFIFIFIFIIFSS